MWPLVLLIPFCTCLYFSQNLCGRETPSINEATRTKDALIVTSGRTMVVDQQYSLPNLNLGLSENGSGTLIIRSGGDLTVGQSVTVGDASSGEMEIHGGMLKVGNSLTVGYGNLGTGSLKMQSGTVDIHRDFTVGANAAAGSVIVEKGLIHVQNMAIGSHGKGMMILNGGVVNIRENAVVGKFNGDGKWMLTGGTVNAAGAMQIGHKDSKGTVEVENGGRLNVAGPILIGDNSKTKGFGNLEVTTGTVSAESVHLSCGKVTLNTDGVLSTHSVTTHQLNDKLVFNGGAVQAKSNHSEFFSGFSFKQVNLTSNGGIIDTNRFTIVIPTEMSGTGGLNVRGSGILTLTGNNTYTNRTTIDSNTTLQLGNGGTIGSITSNLIKNNGILIFNRSDVLSFPGSIQGIGSVIQAGHGKTIFTGNHTYIGNTIIQAGELCVNGQLASRNVLIQSAGVLSGMGTLAGDVWNSGWISPGNSIGTLMIHGNYTQKSNGAYLTQILGTNSDLLAVGGTTHLDGSLSVQLLSVPSSEGYLVLTASHGVKGTFSKVSTPKDLLVEILYDPKEVWLLVLGIGNPMRMIALEKFTPQVVGNIKDVLFNVTNTLYGQLTTRFVAIRSGLKGFAFQGLSQQVMGRTQYSKHALPLDSKQILESATQEPSWDIWASASGVFSKINHVRDLPTTNSITGLFSVGADHRINQSFDVGAFIGYQSTWARYSHGGLRGNGIKCGLYGTAQWQGFYLNGIIAGGANFFNIKHSFDFANHHWATRGNPFTGELDVLLGAGYEHRLGSWVFGMNNSIQYTDMEILAFTQNNNRTRNLNVKVGGQNPNSLIYTLGGNVSYLFQISPNSQILPTIGMYWQHEFLNYGQTIESRLANNKGVPFYFQSQSGARNNGFAVAGVNAQIDSRLGLFAYYTPQFGGNQIYSNAFLIGMNLSF